MYIIIISRSDPASVNISEQLLEHYSWKKLDNLSYNNHPIYKYSDIALMISINEYHLFVDDIDRVLIDELASNGLEISIDTIIFASKHRSESGMRTLTVHPIGNYSKEAEYGGHPEKLTTASPHLMTQAYRQLYKNSKEEYGEEVPYSVTFEVTHHGPYLNTPSFFIEIGSDESAWADKTAAKVISKSIIEILNPELINKCQQHPVAIGIGGGHYAPRHSDVARKKCISFGHMIPNYAIDGLSEKMYLQALERTPGADHVYFHRKALKKIKYRELKEWYEKKGYNVVRADDLVDL
jgi:D-aminoacyl-tRNA deacylase